MSGGKKQVIEQRLMRRIVDGLAGWATYYQACNIQAHYDEGVFYEAIFAIAKGRGFTVIRQAKLARDVGQQGAPWALDFVIHRPPGRGSKHPSLIFVEVKYLRGQRQTQDLRYLRADIEKLRPLKAVELECAAQIAACGAPSKFLLIIGRGDELDRFDKHKSKKNPRVLKMLKAARTMPAQKLVYRARTSTYLASDHRWEVLAIGSPSWPK